ncbi:hypothetical protein Syun_004586 [Stephania yunnanensis]|uniref:LOB domain-containing protein n=1 Tax=Stephania yunnanensis TaxID=152371 RepID=A0AAP0L6L7_9MAGN
MSCNGCRVLRKGCSESCILRPCLQWIESPEAQGHATVFVAKFFGRAGLMSFISSVPENQRPALFQSLLFEACGRTVNPVNGAVGLLWTGNWHVCQAAVETVLRGGTLRPMSPEVVRVPAPDQSDDAVVYSRDPYNNSPSTSRSKGSKRKGSSGGGGGGGVSVAKMIQPSDLDLCLMQGISNNMSTAMGSSSNGAEEMMMAMTTMMRYPAEKRRQGTPSMNSEESVTTSFESSDYNNNNNNHHSGEHKLLNLFV